MGFLIPLMLAGFILSIFLTMSPENE